MGSSLHVRKPSAYEKFLEDPQGSNLQQVKLKFCMFFTGKRACVRFRACSLSLSLSLFHITSSLGSTYMGYNEGMAYSNANV